MIIKLALIENNSIIGFDARLNPGCTEKIEHQLSLCALKNIKRLKEKKLEIKKEWLFPELYSFNIDPKALKDLGLRESKSKPKS